ncbi:MAG: head GIN domain-containing protein [Halobacteriota archaeon]
MKRLGLLALALTSVIFIAGCIQLPTNTGPTTSEVRNISSFSSISYKLPGTLHVDQGNNSTVRVEAGSNVISNIRTEVVDGVLTIDTTSPSLALSTINIYVTTNNVSSVTTITSSGAGSVTCDVPLTANNLRLELTGAGSMDAPVNVSQLNVLLSGVGSMQLRGNTTNMNAQVSGVGSLNAYDLQTNVTSVTVSGVGSAQVTAQQNLTANVSGTGSINYHGSPQVTQSRTGTGSINKTG